MAKDTIAKTFSAVGVSPEMHIKRGESVLWKADLSSDWDGTLVLRRTKDGGASYDTVATITADDDGSIIPVSLSADYNYSFNCSVFTAGTAICTLNNLSTDTLAHPSAGVANAAEVSAVEQGDGVVHKTILRIESLNVDVVSVTTGNGVGGSKVYDFPQGRILVLGTMADLTLAIPTASQADFTDATPEGDIGVGSVAPANADALGTDATDDDLSTATALTMAAYTATPEVPSEASLQFDGTATALDMLVNILIDAADIDDDTTGEILVSGVIVCTWINLGDF